MKSEDHSSAMEKYERVGTQSQAMEFSLGPMLDLHEAVRIERIQARLHYLKQYWAHQVEGEKNFRFTGATVSENGIIEWIDNRIASYKKPRKVLFMTELPKGSTNKVLKRELKAKLWEGKARRIN